MKPETILVVDDEKLIRWSLVQSLQKEGYSTLEAETLAHASETINTFQPDLIILDQILPDGTGIELLERMRAAEIETMVVMLTAVDRSIVAVQAMKLGAFDYVTKPVDLEELKLVIRKALETTRVKRQLQRLREEQEQQYGFCEIIGSSPAIRKVLDFVTKVAQSNATTILITGESGTGKELVARAIHSLSARFDRPLLTVNCSALTETLIESELFGHEKGAFTDAKAQKKGVFELADGGSVFLDELGEISPSVQVKLLRVLDQKTFKRVGGVTDITVDVRIIAATNQALEKRIEDGKFREDLYYRLNVAAVQVPPLRQRGDDVIFLAEHFLHYYSKSFHKGFIGLHGDVQDLFLRYQWPGNVRELKNVIERAALLNNGDYLLPDHVAMDNLVIRQSSQAATPVPAADEEISLEALEKRAIVNALEKTNYNQSHAARVLKISRDTLRYRMKKYGLFNSTTE